MLKELSRPGIYLGVVSNKSGDYLRQEADFLGWTGYFGHIIGAFDAEHDKPAPDPIDLALAGSGIERGDSVWFAGDMDIDLECAVNGGCVPVLVRRNEPQKGEFAEYPPIFHVKSCLELSMLVMSL